MFSIAVFLCFSWTLLGFFNKLSSFILRFTFAEIAEIFAFMMAFDLLESLALTGLVLTLAVALPAVWLRDGFAVKGSVIVVVSALASIVYQKLLQDELPSTLWLILGLVVPILFIVILNYVIDSHPKLHSFLLNMQDRISIVLFIYVPLGLVSLLVFIYRNAG